MQPQGCDRHTETEAEELSLPVRKQAWISLCWRMWGGIFQQKEPSQRQIYLRGEALRVGQDNPAQQIVVTPGNHTQPANMSSPDGSCGLNRSHESVTPAMEFDKGQTKSVIIINDNSYSIDIMMLIIFPPVCTQSKLNSAQSHEGRF